MVKIKQTREIEVEEHYRNTVLEGLEALEVANPTQRGLYIPELADGRVNASKNDVIWNKWWTSPSIRITGKTKSGLAIVAYHHAPNELANATYLRGKIASLRNGAAEVRDAETQRIADLHDEKTTTVMSYADHQALPIGQLNLSDAEKHKGVIAFLGGKDIAGPYLEKHRQIIGDKIEFYPSDDMDDKNRGRLLILGSNSNLLSGNNHLSNDVGCFLGVSKNAENGAPRFEQDTLTLEQRAAEIMKRTDLTRSGKGIALARLYMP